MHVTKATPVLLAKDIQPCFNFWSSFGLKPMLEVPGEAGPSFVIFSNGEAEIMYQTRASAELDESSAIEHVERSIIYLEVASLAEVIESAAKHPIVKPEHTTPYGAREVYIRDPAGNVIGFAELPNQP